MSFLKSHEKNAPVMSAVPRPDCLYISCTNQHQNGCSGFCAALATGQSVFTKHEKEENQIKPMNYPVSLKWINCINKGSHLYPEVCDEKNIFTCISPVPFSGKVLSLSPEVAESAVTHMETNHTVVLQHASHFCISDSKFFSIFS